MKNKIAVIVMMLCTIFMVHSADASDKAAFSYVTFRDSQGAVVDSLDRGTLVSANVTVTNGAENATLVAAVYKNGQLEELKYANKPSDSNDISVSVTVPTGEDEITIKAYAVDSITSLDPGARPATMLSTDKSIRTVLVDGNEINADTNYSALYKAIGNSLSKIEVVAEDNSTKIEVGAMQEFPGFAQVKAIGYDNSESVSKVAVMEKLTDWNTVRSISYYVNGSGWREIPDFNANVKNYTLNLPDNTIYCGVDYKFFGDESYENKITYQQDSYIGKEIGGVVYHPNTTNAGHGWHTTEVELEDGLMVPIKNESCSAYISIDDADKTKYTVTLKAKQPRLTDFTITGGSQDASLPFFVGGAGMNNDLYTAKGASRNHFYASISEMLIGASYFAVDNTMHYADQTFFCRDNATGSYFKFTADHSGTAYVLSQQGIPNTEFDQNGWTDTTQAAKDWTPTGLTNSSPLKFNDYTGTATNGLLTSHTALNSTVNTGYVYKVYKKITFEAGDEVEVFVPGQGESDYKNSAVMCVAIKWDNVDCTYKLPQED